MHRRAAVALGARGTPGFFINGELLSGAQPFEKFKEVIDRQLAEAKKLGIPVVAILDSNSDPVGVDFPIPANDDAVRAIKLYCDLAADAALDGMAAQMGAAGFDIGAAEEPVVEEAVAEEAPAEAAAETPAS